MLRNFLNNVFTFLILFSLTDRTTEPDLESEGWFKMILN